MASSIALNFKMNAFVDKFNKSMGQVNTALGGIEKSSKSSAASMKLLARIEMGKLLVSGLGKVKNAIKSVGSSVMGFANSARDVADKLGKLSKQTGMAVEPLQVLQQIAEYSGLELDSFRNAAQKMSRSLGDAANGTGMAGKALERMGLNLQDVLKMSPSDQFMLIGESIAGIEDPALRSAEAANIFGRNGMAMMPMFKDLKNVAAETGAEMLQLGQVLSQEQTTNIEDMNDSFVKVYSTAKKIGTQVLANFAPMITRANEMLMEFVKNFQYNGLEGGQAFVAAATDMLKKVVSSLAGWADTLLNGLNKVAAFFIDMGGKLLGALAVVGAGLGFDTTGLTNLSLKADFAADRLGSFESKIQANIDPLLNMVDGTTSAKAALADMTSSADMVPSKFALMAKAAESAALSFTEEVGGVLKAGITNASDALEWLGKSPSKVVDGIDSMGRGLMDILEPLGFTKSAIQAMGEAAAEQAKFKESLISNAMSVWDQQAQAMMEQYVNRGANPFEMHEKMLAERQKYHDGITKQLEGLQEQYKLKKASSKEVKESFDKVAKGLPEAMSIATDKMSSMANDLSEWLGFDPETGFDMEGEETLPELEKQSSHLEKIASSIEDIGTTFILGSF